MATRTGDLKLALNEAFSRLRKKGFLAKQKWQCCGGCGFAALTGLIEEKKLKPAGIVFYHSQDAEVFLPSSRKYHREEGRQIYLAFGHLDDAEVVRAGQDIVAAFVGLPGIEVEWDGTAQTRILVKETQYEEAAAVVAQAAPVPQAPVQAPVQEPEEAKLEAKLEASGNDGEHEEKPTVKLIGRDGNAFAILGACKQAARKAKWNAERTESVMAEMMSGDYDHLLATAMKHFEVE